MRSYVSLFGLGTLLGLRSKKRGFALGFCALFLLPAHALAWDGYDYEKGSFVEIDEGTRVRSGDLVEIYDYSDGRYKDMDVLDIDRTPSGVTLEVQDPETGERRTLEMDR